MPRLLLPAFCGVLFVAVSAARADLRLAVTIRLTNSGIADLAPDSLKKDPQAAEGFRKELAQEPDVAFLMGQPVAITEWFTADKERIDVGPSTYLTVHGPDRRLVLDHRKRTVANAPDDPPEAPPKDAPATIADTGRTRTIAGHLTHEFTLSAKGDDGSPLTMRVWAAPDLPARTASSDPFFRRMPAVERAAFQKVKGVVLRFEVSIPMEGGKLATLTEEVTAVSVAPIPASTFEVPAGYAKAG